MEKDIKFEKFSGCFWCGVPQEICNRWEENENGRYRRAKGKDCQYSGVLVAGVIGIALSYNEVGAKWQARLKELGVDGSKEERTVLHYLGKKRTLETVESNNLAGEFCWITQLISE